MKLFDFSHPMFRPLWVRIGLVAICAGWATFEFVTGSPFWGVVFAGLGAVAFHGLFLAPGPATPNDRDGPAK
jgi:hypothetical protein